MRKLLHSLTISIILIGLLWGYARANYGFDPGNLWNKGYFLWDKLKDILLTLCLLFPCKDFRKQWVAVALFFCLREVWEILAIQDYIGASDKWVIFWLFLCDCLVVSYLMFIPLKKEIELWIIALQNRLKKLRKWQRVKH